MSTKEQKNALARKWAQDNKEKVKKSHQEYYKKNKEKITIANKEWRAKNRDKFLKYASESYHRRKNDPNNIKAYLIKHAKARAKQKGLEFFISEEDIFLPDICPILKIKFDKSSRRYSYSLDRIDPTKGYTKDNIWVISQIANAMKWDSTREERILFAKWVLSLGGGDIP